MKTIVTTSIFFNDEMVSNNNKIFYKINLSKKFAKAKVEIYKQNGFKLIINDRKKSLIRENIEVRIGIMNCNYGKNKEDIWLEF